MIETQTKLDIKLFNEAITDIETTIPIIKSLTESVNDSIHNSKTEDAISIINSIFKTLFYISQLIELMESELSSKMNLKDLTIDDKRIDEIEKNWLAKLTELKEAAINYDITKACDIIKYDFPTEIENQIKLLKKLVQIKKEKDETAN